MTKDNLAYGGRIPILKALVGSHNYNLDTPESDKDYKVFVMPTFDDLYERNDYTNSFDSPEEDVVVYDIRKMTHLFFKANVNYLEVLYSKELEMLIDKDHPSYNDIKLLIAQRENICKMNMPYLFHACKGMYYNKMKMMMNNGKDHVESLGYAPKHAMGAYRIMDFLTRYKYFIEIQGDHPFNLAMTYFDEKDKEELLNIRKGVYSLDQINAILESKFKTTIHACEEFYTSQEADMVLSLWLLNLLKRIVKDNI